MTAGSDARRSAAGKLRRICNPLNQAIRRTEAIKHGAGESHCSAKDTMIALLSEISAGIDRFEAPDPVLERLGPIVIITVLIGGLALGLTRMMVDEERTRAEPSVARLFTLPLMPRRVLSNSGRRIQTAALALIATGCVLAVGLAVREIKNGPNSPETNAGKESVAPTTPGPGVAHP